jgi:GntR family transcriptional regulator, transcriptional repressor for pyruvate dehydrogenase complex
MKNLKPVSRITLGEQVAAQLADQISHGRWQPGDRLPSETELCNALCIGRSTLREALKSLAFVGMVQMRPGEGTYVMDGTQALADRLNARGLLRTEKDLRDVSEARLILETELAALAAERMEPADLENLDEILAQMKHRLDEEGREYAMLDVEFHLAIAKSSKNRLLHQLLVPIRETLQEFIAKSQELPGIKQSAHEHHARIVAALRQRNPEKARRAMRAHLSTCEQAFTLLGKISGQGERTSLGLEK